MLRIGGGIEKDSCLAMLPKMWQLSCWFSYFRAVETPSSAQQRCTKLQYHRRSLQVLARA